MRQSLDTRIEFHENNQRNAIIVAVITTVLAIIGFSFGVESWPIVFFIEAICFMVVLISMLRIQALISIRGYNHKLKKEVPLKLESIVEIETTNE